MKPSLWRPLAGTIRAVPPTHPTSPNTLLRRALSSQTTPSPTATPIRLPNTKSFAKPSLPSAVSYAHTTYNLYVQSTRNNTIITLQPEKGDIPKGGRQSGGTVGFKNMARSGYEAGYQCALSVFKVISQIHENSKSSMEIHLLFSGFGQGREAVFRALMTSEGEAVRMLIKRVTDRTPIKIGGTRAKKRRVL